MNSENEAPAGDGSVASPTEHDQEEVVHTRKHKTAMRRMSSFTKFGSVALRAQKWFESDQQLHNMIHKFCVDNYEKSASFGCYGGNQPKENSVNCGGGVEECDHAAKACFDEFCTLFEGHLTTFLKSMRVTPEEFAETLRISQEEEQRDGSHFYRWLETLELPVFLKLMRFTNMMLTTGMHKSNSGNIHPEDVESKIVGFLLRQISELSDEGRLQHRRRSAIVPLLMKWAPQDFPSVHDVVLETQKECNTGLTRSAVKNLFRWKAKLTEPVRGPDGVYGEAPPPNMDEYCRYLSEYCSAMDEETFNRFIRLLNHHVDTHVLREAEDGDLRRAAWEAFMTCDRLFSGKVDLAIVVKLLDTAKAFATEKAKLKTVAKWTTMVADGPSSTRSPPKLNLEQFTTLMTEVFGGEDQHRLVQCIKAVKERALEDL